MSAFGRMHSDEEMVMAEGLLNHSATTCPGTSGTAAWNRADPTKLAFIHIAGATHHSKAPVKGYPKMGVPGTIVAQLFRKFNGGESHPAHHITDKRLEGMDNITKFPTKTWEQDEALELLEQQASTAGVDILVPEGKFPQNLWKMAIRKMRRKRFSKKSVAAFVYAKLNNRVPEYDPGLTAGEAEELKTMWKNQYEHITSLIASGDQDNTRSGFEEDTFSPQALAVDTLGLRKKIVSYLATKPAPSQRVAAFLGLDADFADQVLRSLMQEEYVTTRTGIRAGEEITLWKPTGKKFPAYRVKTLFPDAARSPQALNPGQEGLSAFDFVGIRAHNKIYIYIYIYIYTYAHTRMLLFPASVPAFLPHACLSHTSCFMSRGLVTQCLPQKARVTANVTRL